MEVSGAVLEDGDGAGGQGLKEEVGGDEGGLSRISSTCIRPTNMVDAAT